MKRIVFAAIAGFILVFAFPPFDYGFTAWIALVPLMHALDGAGKKKAFLLGLLFGSVFFLGTVYWVVNSMYYYGGVPVSVSILIMLLLVATLGLYTGLFGLLFSMTSGVNSMFTLALAPCLWVSIEYLRGYVPYFGFPWILIGYSQTPYLPVVQIADITGVWGISFLIAAVNTAIYLFLKATLAKEMRLPVKEVLVISALLILIIAYGFIRIREVDRSVASWKELKVGIIQGSIDQGLKWNSAFEEETVRIYRDLSGRAGKEGADLIVWPETAVPFYLGNEPVRGALIGDIAKEAGSYILTGSPSYNYNSGSGAVSYFNSAYLLAPTGKILGRYDKIHLVPYGEYVPFKRFLPFIKKLTVGVGEFSSGPGPAPIGFDGGKIGTLICFESIFPEIAGGSVRAGATILANITNDAWFGKTSAPYQHFEMSILRAVENRVFLLRAANTGISAVVDPVGRVREKTGLFIQDTIVDNIRLRQGPLTFYSEYGDILVYACILISSVFISSKFLRR